MATKLNGMVNLTKIPKGMIGTTKKGEKCIFVDIVPRKGGADEYGNTHSVQLYNKETKEVIYLGNLKPVEFGGASTTSAPVDAGFGESSKGEDDDLPF